jgi:hypothetical protein
MTALVGCYTNRDAQGRPEQEPAVYRGGEGSDELISGPNRGVNTNYFGPVNSGPEAAWGPGTPSGNFDHRSP